MDYSFFAYLSRMRYITRWSLMRNALDENIQEHSHMVAVLAHALGVIRRDVFGVDCDPAEYAAVALYHDSSEILTGDLPTPIKYYNPAIKAAYKQVERLSGEKLLAMLPPELRPSMEDYIFETDPVSHDIVKAADKLSAHIKCIEELKAGNLEFESAAAQTRRALQSMDLPELNWFMEHCLESFKLNLDELQG